MAWDPPTQQLMQEAWQRQILQARQARHPWGKVAGPCGATFLALKQLGGTSPSAFARRTDQGGPLDARSVAPLSLRDLARDAA
eukprot:6948382-Pyramimonas_sp.AAC.1